MHKLNIVKIGFIALALVLGTSAARSSTLDAAGYVVTCGRNGETVCEPGGSSDCAAEQ